jgi:uncharacterized protein (TIGR02594 family)
MSEETEAPDVAEPHWLRIARGELGVREVDGEGNNKRILEYHAATSLRATSDAVSWCSSFVGWCMREAGVPRTDSAAARSWLSWGHALDVPRVGCVVVLRRGAGWQGHVGFWLGEKAGRVTLLGGNQLNAVSIQSYDAAKILGYRWP